eukprot:6196712-Pleurochrysis_carterae.AAC.5
MGRLPHLRREHVRELHVGVVVRVPLPLGVEAVADDGGGAPDVALQREQVVAAVADRLVRRAAETGPQHLRRDVEVAHGAGARQLGPRVEALHDVVPQRRLLLQPALARLGDVQRSEELDLSGSAEARVQTATLDQLSKKATEWTPRTGQLLSSESGD